MTESQLLDLLRLRYTKESAFLLSQVADQTGGVGRRCDALVMNLWRSRGLTIEGFEIKVSRNDWLRELKNPAKADVFYKWCDYWWIVAPKGVVAKDELPEGWGLLEVTENGVLRTTVKAQKNKLVIEPSRLFIASILRAVQAQELPEAALAEAEQRGYQSGYDTAKMHAGGAAKQTKKAYEELRESVRVFEEASGIPMRWTADMGRVGNAVAAVLARDSHLLSAQRVVERARSAAQHTLAELEKIERALQREHEEEEAA